MVIVKRMYFLLVVAMFFNFALSQDPTDGCELGENEVFVTADGDVLYNIPTDIAGWQFSVEGATASAAAGGESGSAGFTMSAGGGTVLAFSFSGATIATDCGLLVSLTLDGTPTGLTDLVFSDSGASQIEVSYYSGDDNGGGTDEITDGCDLSENEVYVTPTGDVLYNIPTDIAGWQFSVEGATATAAEGGESGSAGFTMSAGGGTVLAFSFSGATIATDCGLLVSLTLDGTPTGLTDLVFSDSSASQIEVSYYSGSGGSTDILGCTDQAACNFNADATLDDGSCEFAEENFDCEGNCTVDVDCNGDCGGSAIEDCAGICEGSAVEDCAGVCNGPNEADGFGGCCDLDEEADCAGVCDGTAVEDECGICEGDGSTCAENTEVSDGCDLPENTVFLMSSGDVLYNVPTDVAGFQFSVDGGNVTGASGGNAELAGFTMSAGGGTVLGFSFSGATVQEDCGVLVTLQFEGELTGLSNITLSNSAASDIGVTYCDTCVEGGTSNATATVQVIHNSASPTVDVYVDGALAVEDFAYRTATPLLTLPTSFTVGIAPADGDVIAEFPFDLMEGGSYVVVATGLLGDDVTPFDLAAAGTTFGASSSDVVGLEVYHGSTDAPAVDIWADDAPLLTDFSYGDFSGFVEVPAADYVLGVAPAGGDIIAAFTAPLSGLGGGSAVAFASGFLSGDDPAFGLFAALNDGTVLALPALDQDCAGEWGGDAVVDECGDCNGNGADVMCDDGSMVCDQSECPASNSFYNVEIAETGESSLFIFNADLEMNIGDELGLFDASGVLDSTGATGEILVGAGVWNGSQLEVTAIHAVDLSQFGGPVLPGATEGNEMMLKVYKPEGEMEYEVSYTVESGSGTFDGLFTAVNSISFGPPPHFNVEIDETGESSLFIFNAEMEGLNTYDEVGLYDVSGVIDDSGNTGEILVGAGVYTGSQLEVTAIHAVDLSQFGGPILPGATEGNTMMLKVWKADEQMEYDVTYSVESGSGTFDGLFTAISAIAFAPTYDIVINEFFFRAFGDVPDYVELFNYGTEDVDLTGWSLTDGEDSFDGSFDGYTLSAGGYLLLAGEDPFFNVEGDELYAGEDIGNSLLFDISLSTSSDMIMLLDGDGNEVDMVSYDNDLGWPSGNDFRGQAAELSDPYSDNNDPVNWEPSTTVGTYMFNEDGEEAEDFGTPGEQNSNYSPTIMGCMDVQACNYNADATMDDGSCLYNDCAGECGGDAVIDDCGVCDGVNDCLDADSLPTVFSLSQNYPNPFNPTTNISFDVAEPGNVQVIIYDILGNYVSTLVSSYYSQGTYVINWNGDDDSNQAVSSGVYIYQLKYEKGSITKKMTLLR